MCMCKCECVCVCECVCGAFKSISGQMYYFICSNTTNKTKFMSNNLSIRLLCNIRYALLVSRNSQP